MLQGDDVGVETAGAMFVNVWEFVSLEWPDLTLDLFLMSSREG